MPSESKMLSADYLATIRQSAQENINQDDYREEWNVTPTQVIELLDHLACLESRYANACEQVFYHHNFNLGNRCTCRHCTHHRELATRHEKEGQ
jgi:hypothetical protein